LDDGNAANGNGTSNNQAWADQLQKADHIVGDVSFSIPQRKKLRLEWVSSPAGDLTRGGVRAMGGDGGVEFGCGWGDIGTLKPFSFLHDQIRQILILNEFWRMRRFC